MTKFLRHAKLQAGGFALAAIVVGTTAAHTHVARATLVAPIQASAPSSMDDLQVNANDPRNLALVPAGTHAAGAPVMLHRWKTVSQSQHAFNSVSQPGLRNVVTNARKLADATTDVRHQWPIPPLLADATTDVRHQWPIPPLLADATTDVRHQWPIPPLLADATTDVRHQWPIPPLLADATTDVRHQWPIPPLLADATTDVRHQWPIPPLLADATTDVRHQWPIPPLLA